MVLGGRGAAGAAGRRIKREMKKKAELDHQVGHRVGNRTVPEPSHVKVDAADQPVGRIATKVATLLQGKHKPTYLPHVENGDYVTIENGHLAALSGRKWKQKTYRWHSGFPGGLHERNAHDMYKRNGPEEILRRAVRGMLPKNKLRDRRMKRLTILRGLEGEVEQVPLNKKGRNTVLTKNNH